MAYADLREYLSALEHKGKLKRVKNEVDKDWEVSAVCRQLFKKIAADKRPALLFENVKGFQMPIAAGVLYPLFGLLLSPMIAAAAMSFSSVSVIANALRLRQVEV